MDYEKKYKDALERAKQIQNTPYTAHWDIMKEVVEHLFPELKESEDERLRKELIDAFKEATDSLYMVLTPLKRKAFIAWLEKQGEQNIVVVIPRFRVGDVIRPKGSTAEYTIESISGECYHGKGWGLHISGDDDYELVEQKPAWSEEDETVLNNLIWALKEDMVLAGDRDTYTSWLEGLKDKVQPQPKQEWSEEDENLFRCAIDAVKQESKVRADGCLDEEVGEMVINWLKSLRTQSTWKPSEEQLEALQSTLPVIKGYGTDAQTLLESLYNNLKKL